ncbi:MraY family glycosyltransferase [Candidatus Magnetominusculus dajiuhuensis]|uniref:MraY family glycosyltransferase n=1 Tax=Candidatus Magnetominusculus dajiuhuensis TaxID=3137712 RepID=UPI003B428CB2
MNQGCSYWTVSLLSIFISITTAYFVARYGHKFSLIDNPHQRSSHTRPTPRGGGIGIWIAFIVIGFLFNKDNHYRLIAIPCLIGLIGIVEDRFHISQIWRMAIQIILSFLSIYPHNKSDILSLLLLSLWVIFIVGTANFYNFMDGINGIATLAGICGFGLMAFFSCYFTIEHTITIMSIALICGCAGFLPLNFPTARVFMGDVGSLLLGFTFALFIAKLSVNISAFLCMIMFMCMFYADALVTLFYRWKRKENLMQPHRRHMYQYLSNELGLPHWKVALIYAGIQFIFGSCALLAYTKGLLWQIAVFAIFSSLFLMCYKYVNNMLGRLNCEAGN